MQRAVWRMRAPMLNNWARRVSICAEGVLQAEELAELVQERQSKTGIAAQLDLHLGEGRLQTWYQAQQHGHDAGMTGSVSRTQPRRQQASAVALEDQHGVIHVLAVS